MTIKTTRRTFLAGAAAGTAALGLPMSARAQAGRVIVGTWGGDYAKLLENEVAPRVMKSTGDTLVLDTGSASARKTKMIASSRVGAGDMDVACLSDSDISQMASQNLLMPVTDLDIPNAENIFEVFRSPYAIPHIYSAMVVVYDKDAVEKAPTSFKDLWLPEFAGKVGLSDILFNFNLLAASLAQGGSLTDFAPGREALEALKADGGVKVYASNEAIANAFAAKEIKATLMWKARVLQWQDAGLPLAAAVPNEGAIPVLFELGATSFAANVAGAAATMNAVLEPEVQLASAKAMGYLPTVSNAPIDDAMRERIGFTDAQRDAFNSPDFGYIAQQLDTTTTWWNQSFKS